ncbi:aminodeoxychorismate lyase [Idiomarina sp. HP20-50]|uniref:aminodeoxychorismate lyase n=1 Tax=Idiomarina sp. HP20-50 TaxID=3070813 RepID=UPI00294B5929|nr:aminodeoxychorismate lyase [Idiomarina sp. HP20-50]MDV6315064.1 aminodeoxychorismate lyase [Idiomarina sp. HP20-50]
MTIRKILLNNQPFHSSEIDRGLQFGDGHFTTIRVVNGEPQLLDRHLQRLAYANQRLFINHPNFSSLHERIKAICCEVKEGVCKTIITRGYGGRGYSFSDDALANEYLQISDLPAPIHSVELGTAELRLAKQPTLSGLKTLNRLEQVLLTRECRASVFDDLLVCDTDGFVVEAIQGNLFWYQKGQWHTPDLSFSGVNGVMRQWIIEEGLLSPLRIAQYTLADLAGIECMIITNSVRGAVTVSQFNGKVLGNCELPVVLEQFTL